MELDKHRLKVIDDIFTLKCPRCKMAFLDYDNCTWAAAATIAGIGSLPHISCKPFLVSHEAVPSRVGPANAASARTVWRILFVNIELFFFSSCSVG